MKSILSLVLILSLTLASVPITAQPLPDSRIALQSRLLPTTPQTSLLPTEPKQMGTSHGAVAQRQPSTISQSGVPAVIRAFKRDGVVVRLQLRDDSHVVGRVGDCRDDRFELIQADDSHDVIPFDQISGFLELETGQVVSTVRQGGIGGVGKPSVKTTVIVMVAVAAALIIFWSTIPK